MCVVRGENRLLSPVRSQGPQVLSDLLRSQGPQALSDLLPSAVWGSAPSMLRPYSWLCVQEFLWQGSGDQMGFWASNPDWLGARQAHSPLYYLSSPAMSFRVLESSICSYSLRFCCCCWGGAASTVLRTYSPLFFGMTPGSAWGTVGSAGDQTRRVECKASTLIPACLSSPLFGGFWPLETFSERKKASPGRARTLK